MNEEEKKAIEKLKERVKIDRSLRNKVESDFDKFCEDECTAIETVLNLIDKQNKVIEQLKEGNEAMFREQAYLEMKINNAKWYIHQEIVRINEDIEDYIDDDRIGNKDVIGEFKETKKQWQDVEKLLKGESKDNLYIDWRKYGEYE